MLDGHACCSILLNSDSSKTSNRSDIPLRCNPWMVAPRAGNNGVLTCFSRQNIIFPGAFCLHQHPPPAPASSARTSPLAWRCSDASSTLRFQHSPSC